MNKALLLILIVAMSSCGRIRQTLATNETYSKEVDKSDTAETVKTTVQADTLVFLEPVTYDVTNHLIELVDNSRVILDTPELIITAKVDTLTGTIKTSAKVKERKIKFKVNKTTEVKRTGKTTTKKVYEQDTTDKQVVKTTYGWLWWLVAAVALVAGYFGIRYLPFRVIRK